MVDRLQTELTRGLLCVCALQCGAYVLCVSFGTSIVKGLSAVKKGFSVI